jgi:hypothetical protein
VFLDAISWPPEFTSTYPNGPRFGVHTGSDGLAEALIERACKCVYSALHKRYTPHCYRAT